MLRTNSNPLALCLYVQICRKYQTRKGFAYLAAKRSRYCGSAEMCEHSEKRNYNSIFDPRTAFPYLFAARDTICSDYACCTACTYHLLARQYTAIGGMHQTEHIRTTSCTSSGSDLFFISISLLTAHKRREAMLIWASPRFSLYRLSFSLVLLSTPRTLAWLLRFQRMQLYRAQDIL